jgi:urease accessory protein
MIRLIEKTAGPAAVDTTLTLPLQNRIKCRLRVTLDNGADAGLFLQRGTTLKAGDLLRADNGFTVRVVAAAETLSTAVCPDPHLLARACYHLGNRHVQIEIQPDRVSYPHDHVLDGMLRGLGLQVTVTEAPFEPEPGAYGGSTADGHRHAQGAGHGHHHH